MDDAKRTEETGRRSEDEMAAETEEATWAVAANQRPGRSRMIVRSSVCSMTFGSPSCLPTGYLHSRQILVGKVLVSATLGSAEYRDGTPVVSCESDSIDNLKGR